MLVAIFLNETGEQDYPPPKHKHHNVCQCHNQHDASFTIINSINMIIMKTGKKMKYSYSTEKFNEIFKINSI